MTFPRNAAVEPEVASSRIPLRERSAAALKL